MSVFAWTACRLGRHVPDRRNVRWDGATYTGHCVHCGTPIHRLARNKWRAIADDAAGSERGSE
jgi:hypothetical protein